MARKSLLARFWARLAERPDTEHEQAILRLLAGAIVSLYLAPPVFGGREVNLLLLAAAVCYLTLCAAVFGWIVLFPASSPVRRVFAAVLDIGTNTGFMYYLGEYGAPLYIVYLLIIFGHCFRYGTPYLYNSLALSIAGFALVIVGNDYWAQNRHLGVGLLVGMIVVSLYVGKLVSRLEKKLQEQAISDPLTGLYNRRYLSEFLPRELLRSRRSATPVAVILIDLDHFKRINDTFGHEAGDIVLTAVGVLLKDKVRGSDIACRYGGEEFALILPEADTQAAKRRAEDIRLAIAALDIRHVEKPLGKITASFGIALFPDHGGDTDALLRVADVALYAAKAGRNSVVVGSVEKS